MTRDALPDMLNMPLSAPPAPCPVGPFAGPSVSSIVLSLTVVLEFGEGVVHSRSQDCCKCLHPGGVQRLLRKLKHGAVPAQGKGSQTTIGCKKVGKRVDSLRPADRQTRGLFHRWRGRSGRTSRERAGHPSASHVTWHPILFFDKSSAPRDGRLATSATTAAADRGPSRLLERSKMRTDGLLFKTSRSITISGAPKPRPEKLATLGGSARRTGRSRPWRRVSLGLARVASIKIAPPSAVMVVCRQSRDVRVSFSLQRLRMARALASPTWCQIPGFGQAPGRDEAWGGRIFFYHGLHLDHLGLTQVEVCDADIHLWQHQGMAEVIFVQQLPIPITHRGAAGHRWAPQQFVRGSQNSTYLKAGAQEFCILVCDEALGQIQHTQEEIES